jgi:hypothetical protein
MQSESVDQGSLQRPGAASTCHPMNRGPTRFNAGQDPTSKWLPGSVLVTRSFHKSKTSVPRPRQCASSAWQDDSLISHHLTITSLSRSFFFHFRNSGTPLVLTATTAAANSLPGPF